MSPHTAKPSLALALSPVAFLVALLMLNVYSFGDGATGGPNQMALFGAALFAALLGRFVLKMEYEALEKEAIEAITLAMKANLILLVVGALIGLWILSGIVPTLIYYGVLLINPSVFLLVACVSCSVVSLAIGSSWSTMGTIGVALVGVGETLGVPLPMVAGAIVSGAYFGDKLSPLSDTTNLAPAAAGTDLFTHVRHLLYTTMPAYFIALAGFAALGLWFRSDTFDPAFVREVTTVIDAHFSVGLHTLATPVLVFAMVMMRMPAVPALVIGALIGAVQALLFQRGLIAELTGGDMSPGAVYNLIVTTAHSGMTIDTGHDLTNQLFNKGGMLGMLNTVLLIIMALFFGGMMEATGMLQRLAQAVLGLVRGTASLVAATIATCVLFNITASDQYLSIVVPGRMFRHAYRRMHLLPQNLSRALEDGGTVTSVLVPWNTCGAFAATVLAVPTVSYLPYTFFNLLCPIVAVAMAGAGWGIAREVLTPGGNVVEAVPCNEESCP